MRLLKNVIANIVGKLWSFISIYLFIPIYIKVLGIESYGIIAFYTVLQTFLTFVDIGLTATLNREFAKEVGDTTYKIELLRTFEYIYLGLAGLIYCGTFIFAPQIAAEFLESDTIAPSDVVQYVRLMGLTIGCNIFVYLYQGGLIGLQRQVTANILLVAFNAIKTGLVILPLWFWSNLYTFFFWQLGCTFLFCWVIRHYLRSYLIFADVKPNFAYLKRLWRYTAGMILMSVIYAANTQIDKLAVGELFSLTYFSYYFLAVTVGQAVLMLVTPLSMAFLPELTRLFSIPDISGAKQLYHKFAFLVTAFAAGVSIMLFFYAEPFITIWQHDEQISKAITPMACLFILSFFFLSIQIAPYNLALANGYVRTNVIMGLLTVALLWPGIYWFVGWFGLIGAAMPRLILSAIFTLILGYIIIKRYLRGQFSRWLFQDTLLPIAITILTALPLYYIFRMLPQGYWTIMYGLIICGISFLANGCVFLKLYSNLDLKQLMNSKR